MYQKERIMSLLLASNASTWVLLGVLVLLLVVWIVLGATRRKKDEASRRTLESAIVPGAKVKTYSGLYGTVVSVTETTDGKIVLLKTGEGNNVSYQNLHINAIYGLDTKAIVTYDTEGNIVEPAAPATPAEVKEEPQPVATKPKKVTKMPKETAPAEAPAAKKETKAQSKETKPAAKKTSSAKSSKTASTKSTKTTK